MAILFALTIFARNLLRGNRQRNTFCIWFWCLAWGSNPSFTLLLSYLESSWKAIIALLESKTVWMNFEKIAFKYTKLWKSKELYMAQESLTCSLLTRKTTNTIVRQKSGAKMNYSFPLPWKKYEFCTVHYIRNNSENNGFLEADKLQK